MNICIDRKTFRDVKFILSKAIRHGDLKVYPRKSKCFLLSYTSSRLQAASESLMRDLVEAAALAESHRVAKPVNMHLYIRSLHGFSVRARQKMTDNTFDFGLLRLCHKLYTGTLMSRDILQLISF